MSVRKGYIIHERRSPIHSVGELSFSDIVDEINRSLRQIMHVDLINVFF